MIFALIFTLSACEKKDPKIPNEEEVITTLTYTLTPINGGNTVVMSFKDLDGDGGNAPEITGGTLMANETYNGVLELLNEVASPAENITTEIEEEDEGHQFFFTSSIAGMDISYNDMDENGNPVGIKTTVTTTNSGAGTLKITLRHEPNKTAADVANGDILNAGGETDIEVSFTVDVQ